MILCFTGELALDIGSVGSEMKMIMILIVMVTIREHLLLSEFGFFSHIVCLPSGRLFASPIDVTLSQAIFAVLGVGKGLTFGPNLSFSFQS